METRIDGRRLRWGLLILYGLVLLGVTDKRIVPSAALLSRLALVESLAERGTFIIDESRFARTVDRVRIGGHFYCDKLPLLPVATAGIYAVLHHGLGISFESHPGLTVFLLTFLTMGVATMALAALFFREVWDAGVSGGRAVVLTGALALATLVFTYGGTYQNHTIAAVFLFAGFRWLRGAREGRGKGALLSGICVGLAAASEIPTGFAFAGAFSAAIAFSGGRRPLARAGTFLGGFTIPVVVTGGILLLAWGDPRPGYLIPGAYDYPGSAFGGREAGVIQSTRVPAHVLSYAFHNLLGIRGLFSTTPVLVAGLLGLVALLRRKGDPRRWEGWALGAGGVATIAFYAVATDSYGGWSYGLRFFVPLAPILLYLAVHLPQRFWSRPAVVLLAALLAVSLGLAWVGVYHPWTPCYQGETIRDPYADAVRIPAAGNICAMAEEWAPASGIAAWARRALIHPDDGAGYLYLAVSFDSQGKGPERDRMLQEAQRALVPPRQSKP